MDLHEEEQIMRSGLALSTWALAALVLTMLLATTSARAQPGPPLLRTPEVYIKMDFWKSPDQQSAEAWHKDPNNGNQWTQLPNDPNPPDLRARARFEINRLFDVDDNPTDWIWFLGVPTIRVVRGSPGQLEDVSGDSRYNEMIDFMVMGIDPESAGMSAYDPCGERIWPIATGSELTTYELSNIDRHYGMALVQEASGPPHNEGIMQSASWRWKNPAGLEEEDVYVEFSLRFDLRQTNNVFGTYSDTFVSWISAGGGCAYTFCLDQSQATALKVGTPHVLDNSRHKLLAAVPQMIDHTAALQLYKRIGTQNTLLIDSPIGNLNSHPTSHKCEPDGAEIARHTHSSGQTGHLRVHGLSAYYFDPLEILEGTQDHSVFAAASFDIPAHAISAPTDHRALYMLFWTFWYPPDP